MIHPYLNHFDEAIDYLQERRSLYRDGNIAREDEALKNLLHQAKAIIRNNKEIQLRNEKMDAERVQKDFLNVQEMIEVENKEVFVTRKRLRLPGHKKARPFNLAVKSENLGLKLESAAPKKQKVNTIRQSNVEEEEVLEFEETKDRINLYDEGPVDSFSPARSQRELTQEDEDSKVKADESDEIDLTRERMLKNDKDLDHEQSEEDNDS